MSHETAEKHSQFFDASMAVTYDEKNRNLSAISSNMHFLTGLVLKGLPQDARILSVGIGTGADIMSLAKAHPEWTFVGVDPSMEMLTVCREKLEREGFLDRCELIHGYIENVNLIGNFDAVLSFLVAHFIDRADRTSHYDMIYNHLKTGGHFVSMEISYDLASDEFPSMLEKWKSVQELMGATKESLENLPTILTDTLSVISPAETVRLWEHAGFPNPVLFFQSLLIHGWYSIK